MQDSIRCIKKEKYMIIEFLLQKFDLFETSKLLSYIESILSENGYMDIVVDLNSVMLIDSSGIGTMIALQSRLKRHEKNMLIVCDNESILKVFRITKMFDFFKICKDMQEADSYFSRISMAG